MPVEFLSDLEVAAYGRFGKSVPQPDLERFFFLDDADRALVTKDARGAHNRDHWAVENGLHRASETLRRFTTLRPRCGYGPRACWAWRQRLSC
jgi:hypothetical protein